MKESCTSSAPARQDYKRRQSLHISTKVPPINSPIPRSRFGSIELAKSLKTIPGPAKSKCGHPPRPSARPSLPPQLSDPPYNLSKPLPLEHNPPQLPLPSHLQAQARTPALARLQALARAHAPRATHTVAPLPKRSKRVSRLSGRTFCPSRCHIR
jgi:hypothetical protein